jgi:hypothetical protein
LFRFYVTALHHGINQKTQTVTLDPSISSHCQECLAARHAILS